VPKARAKKFVAEMARVMENATALVSSFGWKFKVTVPTPVEIKVGPNWKELEDAR
jgi:DNA polymerase I-like protein with 3'-5' exonuclease and polymerase domains